MSPDGTSGEHVRRISKELGQSQPIDKVPESTAAVAVIFRSAGSFLLIRRVERLDDPWSGHVAFPGGHVRPEDATFFETASREAREEVGLDLRDSARFLGYMKSFEPANRKISVVPCVFQLTEDGIITQNGEVSSHRWVPLGSISASSRDQYTLDLGGRLVALPAFRFGDYLVWGLTERILTRLGELAGILA
jgi:8-oxo-dGTP pyrophosphatase MutT (NUDIX family)